MKVEQRQRLNKVASKQFSPKSSANCDKGWKGECGVVQGELPDSCLVQNHCSWRLEDFRWEQMLRSLLLQLGLYWRFEIYFFLNYYNYHKSGSGLESREYGRRYLLRWPRSTFYSQELALISPVGRVRSRTKAMELLLLILLLLSSSQFWTLSIFLSFI
jgi:hypothetical protein